MPVRVGSGAGSLDDTVVIFFWDSFILSVPHALPIAFDESAGRERYNGWKGEGGDAAAVPLRWRGQKWDA